MLAGADGRQYLVGGVVAELGRHVHQLLPHLRQLGDVCEALVARVQVLTLLQYDHINQCFGSRTESGFRGLLDQDQD